MTWGQMSRGQGWLILAMIVVAVLAMAALVALEVW